MNDIVYAAAAAGSHGNQPQVHDQWEFVYCLSGGGECVSGDQKLSFVKGDMMAVPPLTPHFCAFDRGCRIIQVRMDHPTLWLKEPCLISSDGSPHLQAAFEAALYHYRSAFPAKARLLAAYGGLIVCYLSAYHTKRILTPVAAEI